MKIKDRTNKPRHIRCNNCGWEGMDTDCTTEDDNGFDMCPACNETDFEEINA